MNTFIDICSNFSKILLLRYISNNIRCFHFRTVSSTISYNSNSDANAYVFLCSENDLGGVVGIAWVGGTCASSRYGMSSINEYLRDDAVTGAVSLFNIKIYEYVSKS